jgi:hypothetical protein
MKARIAAISIPAVIAGIYLAVKSPTGQPTASIPAIEFAFASWDPVEGAVGYNIYLGEEPNNPHGVVKMDLQYHLNGITEVRVLHNTPVTYASLSAYDSLGNESGRTPEIHYQ